MKHATVQNLVSGILVLCAVTVTTLVVRRELFPSKPGEPRLERRSVAGWERYAQAGQVMGTPTAPVKIVEYSDFQCPFCARFSATLRELRARHPDRVQIVYRHFPLTSIHPHAAAAAAAAECAGVQGRFEAYHDLLFAQQDSIGTRDWSRFAADAGVPDLAAFGRCVSSPAPGNRVSRDITSARELKVEVTPTIVVNGQFIPGAVELEELERLVAAR